VYFRRQLKMLLCVFKKVLSNSLLLFLFQVLKLQAAIKYSEDDVQGAKVNIVYTFFGKYS